jgi:tetratricopeptide (TPR) repeat protein
MGKKIIFITIISFITVITVITVIKLPGEEKQLISPLPASEEENKTSISSPAEEKTYQTVSYYITTSQQFLNKAQELSLQTSGGENSPRQQTPEEKQKIIELINQALDVINQGIAAYPLDDRVFAQRAAIYQALTPIFSEARSLAIQDLKEAIKLNNQNPNYHTQLAQLYLAGGDFEGAALSFYNAHQLAPTDLQILYNLADALEKGGQLTKAAFWFEKLLGLLPANDQNQEKIRQRLTVLKEAITKANLKYLSSPGELALPAASSKEKEIIGTQELPLEQAALASKIIIAGEKEGNNAGQSSAEISLNALSGEGIIPAGQTEITIYNNNVEATSNIVVVPLEGDFKNRVVFVAAKRASNQECQYKNTPAGVSECGWFKVGVDSPPKDKIKFKWWIIN